MDYWDKRLVREQTDARLTKLRPLLSMMPDGGWIRTIREALGMSTYDLANRVGLDQSRISKIETQEVGGDLMLSTLKKLAEGLNMKFVYGFVPETTLEETVQEQARKIVTNQMDRLNHTMRLEQQELTDVEKKKLLDDLVQKLLVSDPQDFWKQ